MRKRLRWWGVWCLLLWLVGVIAPLTAGAYFDRGPVTVVLGQSEVTVKPGETFAVSVRVDPDSDSQLPGCGMAECPQTCGEKNCLNDEGECMCNGLEYQTYYADVSVASSDTAVATASYANGVVNIKGAAAGEATVTVTGMLRQYTKDSKTIQVTVAATASTPAPATTQPSVTEPASGDQDAAATPVKPADPAPAASGADGTAAVRVNPVAPAPEPLPAEQAPQEEPVKETQGEGTTEAPAAEPPGDSNEPTSELPPGVTTVQSDRGPITFVPLEPQPMGKTWLEAVQGRTAFVTFEEKDAAGTVLYAWSFDGQTVTAPADLDLTLTTSAQGNDALRQITQGQPALYLDFAHQGTLPGPATISLRVDEVFPNEAALNLYYYQEETGEAELTAENLVVENAYVTLSLDHCSQYILVEGALASASSGNTLLIVIILAVVIIIAAAVLLMKKKKRRA